MRYYECIVKTRLEIRQSTALKKNRMLTENRGLRKSRKSSRFTTELCIELTVSGLNSMLRHRENRIFYEAAKIVHMVL